MRTIKLKQLDCSPRVNLVTADQIAEARRLVIEHQRASISFVQRYMRRGYNAASQLIEALENEGTVSHANSFGIRAVLKPKEGLNNHR